MPAGYSGTPLPQKLGIRPGARIVALHAPWPYGSVVSPLPAGATITSRLPARAQFVHIFARDAATLFKTLARAERALEDSGMIWVSWPKLSAGVPTDLTENEVRRVALATALVDVKVCAVDDTWSGLKLVRRVKDRGAK